ncbi:hypothetical protein G6F38_005108 [Rhizopus arrhizus]|nr:hypothetical protein G6F38_005108 [Rhizopus arrhizus]
MQTYDDRLTFLLPRPTWVNDVDVSSCYSCNNPFGPLRRRHHCRNCGNIFCHECSSRSVPLPQLGYGTKAVRVCNSCFEVAYLVTYTIDQDHGVSTQIHGVRGLLELAEKDDEKYLHNMVVYGSIDALIWVCKTSKNITLHHLTTTVLATLAQKESIRPVIITKWALPALLSLIRSYIQTTHEKESAPSFTSASTNSTNSVDDNNNLQNLALEILINCTDVLYQLSKAGILSKKDIIEEGILEILLILAAFHVDLLKVKGEENQSNERVVIIQNLSAKSISAVSSHVPLQSSIIGMIQTSDKLAHLLRSTNSEVRKYTAKTIAYLSLRNDKYKPILLSGDGSRALISIIARLPLSDHEGTLNHQSRLDDLAYYLPSEEKASESTADATAVSHACCALANFATNNESQINLMSQPHLLLYICNVPAIFPSHAEIHKHVARCLANLALYEENCQVMLNNDVSGSRMYNILPTLLAMCQSSNVTTDEIRHVIRAIDNLSSNVQLTCDEIKLEHWKELCKDIYPFVSDILNSDKYDQDTIKRAKSILQRKIIDPPLPHSAEEDEEEEGDKMESNHSGKSKSKKKTKKKNHN